GGVSASGSTGWVQIGDGVAGSTCAGNSINGGVTLTGNTAHVELSLNTINGGATVNNNSGVEPTAEAATKPEIEANKITGTLACSGNPQAPTADGKSNSGSGSRTGQCAGF